MKKKISSGCPIKRTSVVRHSTVNMKTGEETPGKTEVVTKECGIPLFGDPICRGCAQGWEVPENKFANEKERARALKLGGILLPHLKSRKGQ